MKEIDSKAYTASMKSLDTEEFLDLWFYRPIGYRCALFFRNRHIHPNIVTLFSIILGSAAGICFIQPQLRWNILGILLLIWANIYDSADGQLARLTGQKTKWGRILDGFAGDIWFVFIYLAIAIRETFEPIPFAPSYDWGISIWIIGSLAGFWVHGAQCQLADYYRNIHLFFLKGNNGSEFDNSEKQKEIYRETSWKGNFFWKIFLNAYVGYVQNQEEMSPEFQKFHKLLKERYPNHIPQKIHQEYLKGSKPLMKYANMITFNSRAIFLWFTLLINQLWLYLAFELIFLNIIFFHMRLRHEKLCKELINEINSNNDIS